MPSNRQTCHRCHSQCFPDGIRRKPETCCTKYIRILWKITCKFWNRLLILHRWFCHRQSIAIAIVWHSIELSSLSYTPWRQKMKSNPWQTLNPKLNVQIYTIFSAFVFILYIYSHHFMDAEHNPLQLSKNYNVADETELPSHEERHIIRLRMTVFSSARINKQVYGIHNNKWFTLRFGSAASWWKRLIFSTGQFLSPSHKISSLCYTSIFYLQWWIVFGHWNLRTVVLAINWAPSRSACYQ